MRKSEKPVPGPRRIWRMTPNAPLGEFVDPDDKPEKSSGPPGPHGRVAASGGRA
jgi:hypothetical protein